MTIADRKPEIIQTTKTEKISGPYHYGVVVDLDLDDWPPSWEQDRFAEVAEKYGAVRMGYSRTRTSDMCFFSDKPLDEKQLAEDLGPDIKIIRVIDIEALGDDEGYDVSNEDSILYPIEGEDETEADANN